MPHLPPTNNSRRPTRELPAIRIVLGGATAAETHEELADADALKSPAGHEEHAESRVAVAVIAVYVPGGHFECAEQVSVLVLEGDVILLKVPAAHATHLGSADADPTTSVYLPGGHFVWAVQDSIVLLLLEATTLKNPGAHATQRVSAVSEPKPFVAVPFWHVR